MYFFHYALDDNTVKQMKDEVDNAVVKSNYYVDDKVSDISTTKGNNITSMILVLLNIFQQHYVN